jgi:FKBP-type peptidyl-prolyl cis-trans isomerase FkpA
MNTLRALTLLLCMSLQSCTLYRAAKVPVEHPLVILDNGVEFREVLPGQGPEAQAGDEISIDYVGYLSDGTQFDSSIERGVPIQFTLGEAPLTGWNSGLLGMRTGGRRRLALPSPLAYGEAGIEGLIPCNETLVFEIDLLRIGAE